MTSCNGKINDIDISLFKTSRLDNNILEQWLFYFENFSSKEPKINKETRTALISGENITFVNNIGNNNHYVQSIITKVII